MRRRDSGAAAVLAGCVLDPADCAAWAFNSHDGNGYGRITGGKCYVRCVR